MLQAFLFHLKPTCINIKIKNNITINSIFISKRILNFLRLKLLLPSSGQEEVKNLVLRVMGLVPVTDLIQALGNQVHSFFHQGHDQEKNSLF